MVRRVGGGDKLKVEQVEQVALRLRFRTYVAAAQVGIVCTIQYIPGHSGVVA